jgi:hypothetical protein
MAIIVDVNAGITASIATADIVVCIITAIIYDIANLMPISRAKL